jgi:hypothetical protein
MFRHMNVPHWFIMPYENALHSRIDDVTIMQFPEHILLSTEKISSVASPIFIGAASDSRKYAAIRQFGFNMIRFPDPFHAKALPEPIISTVGPIRPSGSHRALTRKQRMRLLSSDRKPIASILATN